MLILTRTIGESIRIGEDVTVTVLEVSRHGVKLGIAAPKAIAVWREEIYPGASVLPAQTVVASTADAASQLKVQVLPLNPSDNRAAHATLGAVSLTLSSPKAGLAPNRF